MKYLTLIFLIPLFTFGQGKTISLEPFRVFLKDSLVDVDGNSYRTMKIGTQVWMVENLKVTKFNDGTPISILKSDSEWSKSNSPGMCEVNFPKEIKEIPEEYLYNGYCIDNEKNVCPLGWRIPDTSDYASLIRIVNRVNYAIGPIQPIDTFFTLTDTLFLSDYTKLEVDSITRNNIAFVFFDYKVFEGGFWFSNSPHGTRKNNGKYISPSKSGFGYWWSRELICYSAWYRTLEKYQIVEDLHKGEAWSKSEINKNKGFSIKCIKSD